MLVAKFSVLPRSAHDFLHNWFGEDAASRYAQDTVEDTGIHSAEVAVVGQRLGYSTSEAILVAYSKSLQQFG